MGIHDDVTKRILAELERGSAPWVKPWAVPRPYNAATNRQYNGVNVLLLWNTPYQRSAWLTYQQAQSLGGQVRRGECATQVVYVAAKAKPAIDTGDGTKTAQVIPFLVRYFVFNVEQVERLPARLYAPSPRVDADFRPFFGTIPADVRHGGTAAFYERRHDFIQLPHPEHFASGEQYYATRLHETVHWTGHPSRLDREFGKRFGDEAYAFEELVAELGSAFLSADLGIATELHHADYLSSWVKILKCNKQAIFMAAARASYAAEYLKRLASPASLPEESEAAHA